jgi:hypothetical protein
MVAASASPPRGGARTRLSSTRSGTTASSTTGTKITDTFHDAGEVVVDDPSEVSVERDGISH